MCGMKIAFSTSGNDIEAPLDERFGRAARFLIYDDEGDRVEWIENGQGAEAAQGAGIQAAQAIVRSGAQALVTGHCGPKAFRVLAAAGIHVYLANATTVSKALDAFRAGKLEMAATSDVEGHWS